jgi:hypothetical protein
MRKTRSKWTLSKVAPFKAKYQHLKASLKAFQAGLANHISSKPKEEEEDEMVKIKWLGVFNDFNTSIEKAELAIKTFIASIKFPISKLES